MRDELVDLARSVVEAYDDLPGVRMALLAGSVARGVADERSDIDLVFCVDEVHPDPLTRVDRLQPLGGSRLFALPRDDGFFEKYRVGDRHVDVDVVPRARLETAATALGAGAADDDVIRLAAGIAEAEAIRGAAELSGWKQRLTYSGALARSQVARHSVRLVSVAAVHDLTLARGDAISFARRASGIVLEAVALLGAANRVFIPIDDPKWLPWRLGRLPAVPHDMAGRAGRALQNPTPEALADLDALLVEVLDLVDARVGDADTSVARYALELLSNPRD